MVAVRPLGRDAVAVFAGARHLSAGIGPAVGRFIDRKGNKVDDERSKLLLNLANPERAFHLAALPSAGVGLVRIDGLPRAALFPEGEELLHQERRRERVDGRALVLEDHPDDHGGFLLLDNIAIDPVAGQLFIAEEAGNMEIVVIDNASDDDSVAAVRSTRNKMRRQRLDLSRR